MIRPKSIDNDEVLEAYGERYMYLGCVHFVKQVGRRRQGLRALCGAGGQAQAGAAGAGKADHALRLGADIPQQVHNVGGGGGGGGTAQSAGHLSADPASPGR
jgi:hypothetical protein